MAGCELLLSTPPASSTLHVFAQGMTPQFNRAHLGKQPLAEHTQDMAQRKPGWWLG